MAYAQIIASESISASGLNKEQIFKNAVAGTSSQQNGLNALSEAQWQQLKSETPLALQKSKSTILSYKPLSEVIRQTQWSETDLKNCGFIFATTTSEIDQWEDRVPFFDNENIVRHQSLGIILEDLKSYFKFEGPCSVVASSCSASLQALVLATAWIKSGKVDRCIVGSTEILSTLTTSGFESLRLLSKQTCQPFDKMRAGINLGEASAFMALEKISDRSSAPLAYIAGCGLSSDAYHATSPQPDGQGCERAIHQALAQAQISADEVSWFYAHGTGSSANDLAEAKAVERLFKHRPFVSSSKSIHGHTLATSGLLESVLAIEAMKNQTAIPNSRFENQDPAFDINLTELPTELNYILKNSLGFGGINCSVLISKENFKS